MKFKDKLGLGLTGHITVYTVPADCDPLSTDHSTVLIDGKNLIVDSAKTVILGLLARDFGAYAPYYIGIGDGGDIDPESGFDTGARVPPAATDIKIRSSIAKRPIVQADRTISGNTSSVTYGAVARPAQAITSSLNELTVETINNTLVSHYVEIPAPGEVRAKKHIKSSLEYLIVRWTFTIELN